MGIELNNIKQGDCIEAMKDIPDDSFNMTFADPPFNLGKNYNGYSDNKKHREYIEWCEKWLEEMVRITRFDGSIFIHNIPKWLSFYTNKLNEIARFKHWISWDAPTAPMGKSLQPNHYGVLFYVKENKENKFYQVRYPHKRCRKCNYLLKNYGGKKAQIHPFGPLLSDVWTDIHRIRHNKYRDEHPCQLPIHLLERLILMSTDEGDSVFDPFIGTGTTAIAAKKLGRKYFGFDIDQKYVDISLEKLRKIDPDSRVDNIWLSIYRDEIITIRDKDWESLLTYFEIPDNKKLIDREKIYQRTEA